MIIDCDTCEVRGTACAECVVSCLLGEPAERVEVDEAESAALSVLAAAGLLPPLRLVAIGGCNADAAPAAGSVCAVCAQPPRLCGWPVTSVVATRAAGDR
jgi:hypothetical protein